MWVATDSDGWINLPHVAQAYVATLGGENDPEPYGINVMLGSGHYFTLKQRFGNREEARDRLTELMIIENHPLRMVEGTEHGQQDPQGEGA